MPFTPEQKARLRQLLLDGQALAPDNLTPSEARVMGNVADHRARQAEAERRR